ncbi:MAG: hypothetical protein WC455_16850 [Dehalococcoidia bacterium]
MPGRGEDHQALDLAGDDIVKPAAHQPVVPAGLVFREGKLGKPQQARGGRYPPLELCGNCQGDQVLALVCHWRCTMR